MSVHSLAAQMVRRRGSHIDDVMLRAIAALVLLGIAGSLLNPTVAAMTVFVLYSVLVNGPYSAALPAAYEPVLMLYGQVFAPMLVGAFGTIAVVFAEWVNYHLYGHARDTSAVRKVTGGRLAQRVIRMFEQRPFLAIVICGLGVVPYWIVRCLSVVSRYPIERHLVATAVGRFPRLWAIAALGVTIGLPPWVLLATVLFSLIVAGSMWLVRPTLVSQSA
jgi:uncharacterized membrane protein YdjX (TVP38/TMEM64 family)